MSAMLLIEELLIVLGGVVVAEDGDLFVKVGESLPSQSSVSGFITTRIDELVESVGEASR